MNRRRTFGVELSGGFDILKKDVLLDFEIDAKVFNFAAGEPHVELTLPTHVSVKHTDVVVITSQFKSFQDLGVVALTVDALRRMGFKHINLVLPYMPAARQDRVMVKGEPLSLKIVAEFINSMKLSHVIVWDAHSDVTTALVDKVTNVTNHSFVGRVVNDIEFIGKDDPKPIFIVSPDAGSNKKIHDLLPEIHTNVGLVKCDKHRDVKNKGRITHIDVYATEEEIKGATMVIVDDICDGGATFLMTAEALKKKGAGKIYLAVTHGIFSKGFDKLNELFDGIYTTNSYDGERDAKVKELPYL